MEAYKIKANEEFFNNLIFVLREGGEWRWPDARLIFTKTGGKLTGDPGALQEVRKIVSEKYFKENFEISKIIS